MNHQPSKTVLDEALRAVAAEDARTGASAGVEARLVAAVAELAAARRARIRYAVALTAAAALVAAVAASLWKSDVWKSEVRSPKSEEREIATEFMPLPYNAVPMASGQVVRLEVPRATLVSFGVLPIDSVESLSSGTVLADVIVGDDGLARAVRFVRRPIRKEQP